MYPRRLVALLPVLVVVAVAACGGSRQASAPRGGVVSAAAAGASAPSAAVEQLLRLAGRKQYLEMGNVFGTAQGPVSGRDAPRDVERRMYGLATVLENNGFTILDESPIPGTVGQGVRMTVQLRKGDRTFSVPFTTVRGPADRWFVETVDVERITAPR